MTQTATMTGTSTLDLVATDVTAQKKVRVRDVSPQSTVGELVKGLLAKMGLTVNDRQGRPINYRARLRREGRHLHGSELVGDALQADDEITLQPRINAA